MWPSVVIKIPWHLLVLKQLVLKLVHLQYKAEKPLQADAGGREAASWHLPAVFSACGGSWFGAPHCLQRSHYSKMLLLRLCNWCIRMMEPCETSGAAPWKTTVALYVLLSSCLPNPLAELFLLYTLWERKKIWQFPLLFPWHIPYARKLAQCSWYCPLLGRCCICTPRSCLVWPFWWNPHGTVSHPPLPREQAEPSWVLHTLSVYGCCISSLLLAR